MRLLDGRDVQPGAITSARGGSTSFQFLLAAQWGLLQERSWIARVILPL
jgi:hypothetical protein